MNRDSSALPPNVYYMQTGKRGRYVVEKNKKYKTKYRYYAKITYNGKSHYIGKYVTAEIAYAAVVEFCMLKQIPTPGRYKGYRRPGIKRKECLKTEGVRSSADIPFEPESNSRSAIVDL